MTIKIKDLAQRANVSPATVSMALNNKAGISRKTKAKIMQIAEESGYTTPLIKRDLQADKGNIQLTIYRKHSKVVGDTPFFQPLIESIESKSRHNGYHLIIKYVSEASFDMDEFQKGLESQDVNMMLLLATEMDEPALYNFLKLSIPILVLDAYFLGVYANYAVINNVSGGYLGTRHLLACGHRKIGYLQSTYPIQNFKERYAGYSQALLEYGLRPDVRYTVQLSSVMENAYDDMLVYLNTDPELPTAFFADNDLIAFGAIKALKEKNIRIPDDVSIVGFDDMPFCTMTDPPLSTISVNKKVFGRMAVEQLIRLSKGNQESCLISMLDVLLIKRDSVKEVKP